ncbi:hypothetical protein Tco_0524152 [Tanacetum coccineum]
MELERRRSGRDDWDHSMDWDCHSRLHQRNQELLEKALTGALRAQRYDSMIDQSGITGGWESPVRIRC